MWDCSLFCPAVPCPTGKERRGGLGEQRRGGLGEQRRGELGEQRRGGLGEQRRGGLGEQREKKGEEGRVAIACKFFKNISRGGG